MRLQASLDQDASRTSLKQKVVEVLRQSIISNELAAGTVLLERGVAERLGVSRTPVREAFQQLASTGLVRLIPNRGAEVSPLTAEDVREIIQLRERLETLAVRLATENATEAELAELGDQVEAMRQALESGDFQAQYALDNRFHATLACLAKNGRLLAILQTLSDQIQRLTYLSVGDTERAQQSFLQHQAVYEAMRRREPDASEAAMGEHIRSIRSHLFKRLGF